MVQYNKWKKYQNRNDDIVNAGVKYILMVSQGYGWTAPHQQLIHQTDTHMVEAAGQERTGLATRRKR